MCGKFYNNQFSFFSKQHMVNQTSLAMATYIQLLNFTKIHMGNIPMVQKLSLEVTLAMEEPFVIVSAKVGIGVKFSL